MSPPLRIAIADDERPMRAYFHRILPTLGHEIIITAETGKQLVERCRATRADLVITDICMPDMDGIEAAHTLCKQEPLPVILVTAYHDQETVERAQAAGVLVYLVKPIKANDLQAAIPLAMRRFEELQESRSRAEQGVGMSGLCHLPPIHSHPG
jgi:two-component system, response regulator PdtaR